MAALKKSSFALEEMYTISDHFFVFLVMNHYRVTVRVKSEGSTHIQVQVDFVP